MRQVSSWGRLDAPAHRVIRLTDPEKLPEQLRSGPFPGLAYGMGRSYGDVCLNPDNSLWETAGLDHFVAFDDHSGLLVCEAGVLLRDIQQLTLPRGWMLPVTPGTQLVTVGGAIANDVHGKNHHLHGTFGEHVRRLTLVRTDGTTLECGPDQQADWFAATVGGLGLTGVIVRAELQLRRVAGPWLETEALPFESLEAFFSLADHSVADWEHTVSWIDCMASGHTRGVFMRGRPSAAEGRRRPRTRMLRMPFVPPVSLVNALSLRPFNQLYYLLNTRRRGRTLTHYEPFFYPLDNLLDWNRMYGPRGFYQYQSVVPQDAGLEATKALLAEIARAGEGSFLAVLKTFGEREPPGMLSFPQAGVTLALDFPNRGERTRSLLARLDAIVLEARGRLYAAKDARMPRTLFEAGYPRLPEFLHYRDPGISSGLSRRLLGH